MATQSDHSVRYVRFARLISSKPKLVRPTGFIIARAPAAPPRLPALDMPLRGFLDVALRDIEGIE